MEKVTTTNPTPDATPGARQPAGRLDWRIWLGLALTAAWLLLGALYISIRVGWTNVVDLSADILGNFLEGAFAPWPSCGW